jgi:hypothetical protein
MSGKLQMTPWRGRFVILASIACTLGSALALTGCETIRVGSDYDREANFTRYHSFTWLPREDYGARNPLIVQRARDAIQASLQQKGYQYTTDPAAADFAVDFTVNAQQRTDINMYPAAYAGDWHWYGPHWWGYPYWGTAVDVYQYREGVLAIDAFDAKTHRPVWHGWAKKALTHRDMEQSGQSLREAADAVLAKFPPG